MIRVNQSFMSKMCYAILQECSEMDASESPFVPTVTAISTTPDLQWMVQPTMITSIAQSQKALGSVHATHKAVGGRGQTTVRKAKNEQVFFFYLLSTSMSVYIDQLCSLDVRRTKTAKL